MSLGSLGFNGLRGCAEMPLRAAFFLLLRALAENIFVLRVGLRQVVVAKALAELQIAAAFSVALDDLLDAPFDFGRRTLPAATKILVVFDFELADVALELPKLFVHAGHGLSQSSISMLGAACWPVNGTRVLSSRFATVLYAAGPVLPYRL